MKVQSEITTCSGNKSRELNQSHAAAIKHQIPPASSQPVPAQYEFTIEEHLNVQGEIEERAHRWFTNGYTLKNSLNDWLKAENEVLLEFVKTRTQRRLVQPTPRVTKTKTGGTSVFTPAIFHQSSAIPKLKSTSAFQHSL